MAQGLLPHLNHALVDWPCVRMRGCAVLIIGDFAIVSLFPLGPSGKEEKAGALVGEVIYVASNKDVKDWKKAGEWCVLL